MDQAASRDERTTGLTVRIERRALAKDVAWCSCDAQSTSRQANKELQYQGLGQSRTSADGTHRRRSSAVRCDIQDRLRPGGEAERGRYGQPDMLGLTRLSVWALTEVPRMPVNDAAALRSATFLLQLLSEGKRVSACRAASVEDGNLQSASNDDLLWWTEWDVLLPRQPSSRLLDPCPSGMQLPLLQETLVGGDPPAVLTLDAFGRPELSGDQGNRLDVARFVHVGLEESSCVPTVREPDQRCKSRGGLGKSVCRSNLW